MTSINEAHNIIKQNATAAAFLLASHAEDVDFAADSVDVDDGIAV